MVDTNKYQNLVNLFEYFCPKINSSEQISAYFKAIFEDLTTRCEIKTTAIDINRFHLYMQLPYHISRQLFRAILQHNKLYVVFEEFENGLRKIYFDSIPNQVQFMFKFYDINQDNLVYPYDIKVILRQFHMIHNSCDISLLDKVLSNALDEMKEMDYNQWKELLVNNSDIFSLTISYFSYFKPFHEENVAYFAKIAKTQVTSKDIPVKTFEILADSTSLLFDYINSYFHKSLHYEEHALSDDDDLKELIAFEKDKEELLTHLNEIGKKVSKQNSKKRFETQILAETSSFTSIPYERKNRSKDVSSTTIQSNLILCKLKLKNGILTTIDGKDSKGKTISQNIRFDCLRLIKGELKKCSLNLLNDELFIFKFTKQNIKKFKNLLSLKRFYIANEDNSKIQGMNCFQIDLISDMDYKQHSIRFYFETKDSGFSFINHLKKLQKNECITDQYDLAEELINEDNGPVLKAYNKKNINTYLVKQIAKKNKDMQTQFDLIHWELSAFNLIKKANHPSLIKAIEKYESINNVCLVYEFPTEGQLLFYLQKNKITSLKMKLEIFMSITSSIQYLHSFGFVYGNCITSNVFVFKMKKMMQFKLINYELAQVCPDNKTIAPISETKFNRAPELIDGRNVFNQSIDVWNLGHLLFSMVYEHKPFDDKDIKKKKLIFPELTIEKHDEQLINKLKEIISGCLQPEIKDRPSIDKLIDQCKSI